MIFNRDIHRQERKRKVKKWICLKQKADMQNQVIVNNRLNMENHERIMNVCMGFSIQSSRLLKFAEGLKSNELGQAQKVTELMKTIQYNLLEIADKKDTYYQHLSNGAYCRKFMKPYAKALEQVISETDVLVKGVQYEQEH